MPIPKKKRAGRPSLTGQKAVTKIVRLPENLIKSISKLGNDSLSLGIINLYGMVQHDFQKVLTRINQDSNRRNQKQGKSKEYAKSQNESIGDVDHETTDQSE